jgi:hypothetical protein
VKLCELRINSEFTCLPSDCTLSFFTAALDFAKAFQAHLLSNVPQSHYPHIMGGTRPVAVSSPNTTYLWIAGYVVITIVSFITSVMIGRVRTLSSKYLYFTNLRWLFSLCNTTF